MQIEAAGGGGSKGENADLGGERRMRWKCECRFKQRAAVAAEERMQI